MVDYKNPNYEFISSQDRLTSVAKVLSEYPVIAIDTEADSLDPYLSQMLLLQIAAEEKSFVIKADLDLNCIKPILENPKTLKILQNGKFDWELLKVKTGVEIKNIFDTMIAERILTMGIVRENSLGAIAKKYLDIRLDKNWESYAWDEAARTGRLSERQLKYAALDTLVLFPIFKKQFLKIKEEGLLKVAELEFKLIPVVASIELRGLKVDVNKWRENINKLKEKRDGIAKQIQDELRPLYRLQQVDMFGESAQVLNLNSPLQILEAFQKLGIELVSTGEAILSRTNHPLARLLLQYRECEKLISAFGENLLGKVNPVTKRVHPDYMQIGADTGRFACSNPNLQQIPQDSSFRSCFIAEDGYKFVVCDYSQIELRIMAELSGDKHFMSAYQQGADLHTKTASQMYGIPDDKVNKKMRFNAKSINFGLMYGRGATSLAAQLGVSTEESQKLLEKYFSTYGGVRDWLTNVAKAAIRLGYSQTLLGRKRWFTVPEKSDPNFRKLIGNVERQAKNTPIQGSSADITKLALVAIYDKIKEDKLEAYIIHTVHDEIVVEAKDDIADKVREIVEFEMIRSGKALLKKVPVEVDAKISSVWEH